MRNWFDPQLPQVFSMRSPGQYDNPSLSEVLCRLVSKSLLSAFTITEEPLRERASRSAVTTTCSRRRASSSSSTTSLSAAKTAARSEEHTSELQSRPHLVCRLLLEKKKKIQQHS